MGSTISGGELQGLEATCQDCKRKIGIPFTYAILAGNANDFRTQTFNEHVEHVIQECKGGPWDGWSFIRWQKADKADAPVGALCPDCKAKRKSAAGLPQTSALPSAIIKG